MFKVIGLKENLNQSTFLKFFLQSHVARLHKLNNVPDNDAFYIKYNKIYFIKFKISNNIFKESVGYIKKYRKEF